MTNEPTLMFSGRFKGLHRIGFGEVNYSSGTVRGIVVEKFVREVGGVYVPSAVRIVGTYVNQHGHRELLTEANAVTQTELAEKLAFLQRECDTRSIELVR